jgi:hypothetical protein
MAILFVAVKSISRKAGQSAVAAAAYRTGTRLTDERTGRVADFTRRSGVVACGMAGWQERSLRLWNEAEACERRKDAMVAREALVAIPHELAPSARLALTASFADYLHRRHGIAVEWAVHAPAPGGDCRAHHAHLLLTTRRAEEGHRLGPKARELDVASQSRVHIEAWRRRWAELCNEALRDAGCAERVDHRSYQRQAAEDGLPELLPQVKEGPRTPLGRPANWPPQARRINAARAALNAPVLALRREASHLGARLVDIAADQRRGEERTR